MNLPTLYIFVTPLSSLGKDKVKFKEHVESNASSALSSHLFYLMGFIPVPRPLMAASRIDVPLSDICLALVSMCTACTR